VEYKKLKGVILASTFILFLTTGAAGQYIESIQFIGNFPGISCDPADSINFMTPIGDHTWKILRLVNLPGEPDTLNFYFTKNAGEDYPYYWGWSGVWGVAVYDWSPPQIVTILPDTGYYYFYFKDDDYTYWLDRPTGCLMGTLTASGKSSPPPGASVTLLDSLGQTIGIFSDFTDSSYHFDYLCESSYTLMASAPGYRDTLITGISLCEGDTLFIPITLESNVAVAISSYYISRDGNSVMITWSVKSDISGVAFDIFRGKSPELKLMTKRNISPITGSTTFAFRDELEDPYSDYYYYIIEISDKNPVQLGPILSEGTTPRMISKLHQNFPNPFNPATTIPYTIGEADAGKDVTISFYDVSGKLLEKYHLGTKGSGEYTFRWNPAISTGKQLPSGVYYCRLQVGKEIYTRKLILLR